MNRSWSQFFIRLHVDEKSVALLSFRILKNHKTRDVIAKIYQRSRNLKSSMGIVAQSLLNVAEKCRGDGSWERGHKGSILAGLSVALV